MPKSSSVTSTGDGKGDGMAGGARLRENDAQDGVSSWQSETLGDNGGTLLGEEGMANEGNDNDAAASRSAATVAAGASNDNADDDQVTAQHVQEASSEGISQGQTSDGVAEAAAAAASSDDAVSTKASASFQGSRHGGNVEDNTIDGASSNSIVEGVELKMEMGM